jgi:negative regulator of sigma E activity
VIDTEESPMESLLEAKPTTVNLTARVELDFSLVGEVPTLTVKDFGTIAFENAPVAIC